MRLLPLPQILPYRDAHDPSIRGWAVAGYGHISLASLPWHLKEDETRDGVRGVKASSTRRVLAFEEDVFGERPVRLYAKRNLSRSLAKSLSYRLHRSKGRREWEVGWTLLRRGFLTGRPIVVAERRHWGLVAESHLVTEAIAADRTLLDHLRLLVRERGVNPDPLFAPLGAFLRSLHGAGFYHDDLSAEHVWIRDGDPEPQFGLIDLDQCRFTRLTRSRVTMNLFQLLRSIPKRLLSPEQREALLAACVGDNWPEQRAAVLAGIRRIEAAKGARDTLG